MEIETLQTLELLILFFGIELAQMKLDEFVENVIKVARLLKKIIKFVFENAFEVIFFCCFYFQLTFQIHHKSAFIFVCVQ